MVAAIDEVLLDHAHCEKKAASTAMNLIFRYPHYPQLAIPLSQLAREELEHFEQVIGVLRQRGLDYAKQKPSTYAARLMQHVRGDEPNRLLDTLLACSLIEARSCERMQLLGRALRAAGEDELAAMYESLLASEARHHASYVDLARACLDLPPQVLQARLAELARAESDIIKTAPKGDRLHDG